MLPIGKGQKENILPVEQGKGQIWLRKQFLCDVEYVFGEPMRRTGTLRVQRILFTLEDAHCATLLNLYGLILVTEDKARYPIPHPLQHTGLGRLECYVESGRDK